jgi:hypothetical protein
MNQEEVPHPSSPVSDVQSLTEAGSVGGDPPVTSVREAPARFCG